MSSIVAVSLMSNKQRNTIEEGVETPTFVEVEVGSSNTIAIDSKDRTAGDLSEFLVDLKYQLMKGRYLQVKRVVVPKIPNVNVLNNTVRMRSEFGGGTTTAYFTIPPGLYNTTNFSNALTTAINAAFVAAGIVDTVTTTFDPITRTFSLASVNAINLCFDETCDFIRFGKNLAPFESQSVSVAATKTTLYSGTAGMIYTRYLSISSDALTQYSVGNSLLSAPSQPPSIIAVVDLVDLYTEMDFDLTKIFGGVYRSVDVNSAPRLRVCNPSKTIPQNLDFQVKDEYGKSLNQVVQLGAPYPTDQSSITILMEITF